MPSQRPKTKDPRQEQLRLHKKEWNSAYKAFTQRLKGAKGGINGQGSTVANIPPSDIKNPPPMQLGSLLSQLSQEFAALVEGANDIMREQTEYSRNRRKKQPKRAPGASANPSLAPQSAPTSSPAAEALSRLGSSINNSSIRKEALWGTLALGLGSAYAIRLLMKAFSRNEQSRFRLGMRRNAIELHEALLDLENSVLSLSENSIPKAMKKFQSAQYNFDSLLQTFNYIDEILKEKAKDNPPNQSGQPEEGQSQNTQEGQPAQQDKDPTVPIEAALHRFLNLPGVSLDDIKRLHQTIIEYRKEEDPATKSLLFDVVMKAYNSIANQEDEAQEVESTNAEPDESSEQDSGLVEGEGPTTAQYNASNETVKTAHNLMTRFLKRQLLKAHPMDKTVPHRIKVVEITDACKKEVKSIIDMLKSGIEPVELGKDLLSVNDLLGKIAKVLGILGIVHKRDFYNDSGNDPLTDQVFKQKIRKDLLNGLR
jgi:hypothetical protein